MMVVVQVPHAWCGRLHNGLLLPGVSRPPVLGKALVNRHLLVLLPGVSRRFRSGQGPRHLVGRHLLVVCLEFPSVSLLWLSNLRQKMDAADFPTGCEPIDLRPVPAAAADYDVVWPEGPPSPLPLPPLAVAMATAMDHKVLEGTSCHISIPPLSPWVCSWRFMVCVPKPLTLPTG